MSELTPYQTLQKFYEYVGRCITEWAHIERLLFEVFQHALGSAPIKAAAVFYGRERQIRGRFELTKLVIELTCEPNMVKEWRALKSRADKLAEFRNFIAHNPAQQFSETQIVAPDDPEGQAIAVKILEWFAIAEDATKLTGKDFAERWARQKANRATLADLENHHLEVQALMTDLAGFLERLRSRPAEGTPPEMS